MKKVRISITEDFSALPAGRHRIDGPHSGQHFCEDVLLPALSKYNRVVVDLDGTLGFSYSFLEEAFGGLIRAGFRARELRRQLKIDSMLETYKERVWDYIDEADACIAG